MDNFNAKRVKENLVQDIRYFFDKNGPNCNAIIGISGGKDSSVVAALCVEALGKDRVIGVLMPNNFQSDISASFSLVNFLEIKNYMCDIYNGVRGVLESIEGLDFGVSEQTRINLPARIRMATLYAISQSNNGRVMNTCNLSEDWVGYATRYGDAAGDYGPLQDLTVTEVIAIGKELGLPDFIVEKTPTDGLCGLTDEENLGFTYATLDRYIRTGEIDNLENKKRIDEMHEKNLFKLELMPKFEYGKVAI